MARDGIEPSTFRFSVGRSYQLSYLAGTPKVIRIPAAPLAKTSDFLIGREHDEVTNCDVAWCLGHVHNSIRDWLRCERRVRITSFGRRSARWFSMCRLRRRFPTSWPDSSTVSYTHLTLPTSDLV